jgi:hypothetical protein
MFHGPVTQNAACPLRNAFCAVLESTFEVIRPSRFLLSIRGAFLRNALFESPMLEGLSEPPFVLPKT